MKKVLIIGPEFFGYNESIERAFVKLGFQTSVIAYTPGQVRSFGERLRYHLSADKELFFNRIKKEFNEAVLALYESFRPDLVFIIQGNYIRRDTVEKLKCKKVLWMMDSIFRAAEAWEIRNSVDYIFVFEKTDVDKLWEAEKIKATFLPLALDESVYFPINMQRDIDILFVGALYEKRIELLRRLTNRFRHKRIQIYGHYYSPLRRPLYHLLRKDKKVFLNKNLSPREVNVAYSRSKICLNIHHSQSRYGTNQRFFEISGSKAFQLVDNNPYVRDNFSEDEMIIYHSEEDLHIKIEEYLKSFETATLISTRAYTKVLRQHTFTDRIITVLQAIGD